MQLSALNKKTGETMVINSDLSQQEACNWAAKSKSDFARDLAKRGLNGALSQTQMFWLHKIALDEKAKVENPVAGVQLPGASKAFDMFASASAALQFPKIILFGSPTLRLYVAGSKSQNPGDIVILNDDSRQYLGRISKAGEFFAAPAATAEVSDRIKAFVADPVAETARNGKEAGSCCFCRRTLSDARSLEMGYGPTCANRFGLPWGETKAKAKKKASAKVVGKPASTSPVAATTKIAPVEGEPRGLTLARATQLAFQVSPGSFQDITEQYDALAECPEALYCDGECTTFREAGRVYRVHWDVVNDLVEWPSQQVA